MIARIFICTPYASRKSHRRRTSDRGGVQAENVNTASSQRYSYLGGTWESIELCLKVLETEVTVQFRLNPVKADIK